MKFNVAHDARPQVKTLLIATLLSIVLWFIPFAEYLVYPFKLFVTFIHESGHALAALITGSEIKSLTVSFDTSGAVLAAVPNTIAAKLLVSSAGYIGATLFGALLLILIRRAVQARVVLAGTAVYLAVITLIFGFFLPVINISQLNVFNTAFTVASGFLLAGGLLLIARYASAKVATFFLSFLAVQCVLNALYDLKTILLLHTPLIGAESHSDAINMANATNVPAIFWVLAWIGISLVIVSIGLRLYAVGKMRSDPQRDLPFED